MSANWAEYMQSGICVDIVRIVRGACLSSQHNKSPRGLRRGRARVQREDHLPARAGRHRDARRRGGRRFVFLCGIIELTENLRVLILNNNLRSNTICLKF